MINLLSGVQGADGYLLDPDLFTFTLSDGTVFRITTLDRNLSVIYPSFNGPLATATVHSGGGGSGYGVGDVFAIGGGGIGGQGLVCTETGGAVSSIVVFSPGNGYATANAVSTTAVTGSGVGLTVDVMAFSDTRTGTY